VGTAFTLFFLPAIYVLVARDHRGREEAAPAWDGGGLAATGTASLEGPPEPHELGGRA
jgi:hypothetical protein